MDTVSTLKLIVARSPDAMREALGAIKAKQSGSPMAARRAERAASLALEDGAANWTPAERAALAELLGAGSPGEPRTLDIRIRVNASEKGDVQQAADEAGLSVSNYIRQSIGLPILD